MTQVDYKIEIDAWLNHLRELETRKIRQIVVCALQAENQLSGQNTFNIPFHLFESARITNREKQKSILLNLHTRKIIDVSRKPNGSNEQQQLSTIETITDNPEVIYRPDTQITVFPEKFDYLAKRLDEIVKKYEVMPTQEFLGKLKKQKIEWQNNFRWENYKFVFGEYGSIEFISPERRALFKKLTDAKGQWVAVRILKGNKNDDYVRSTLSQIEERMSAEIRKYVSIPSTKDDGAVGKPELQGAYRIKFSSKP